MQNQAQAGPMDFGDLMLQPADPADIPQDQQPSQVDSLGSDDGSYDLDNPVGLFGGDPYGADGSDSPDSDDEALAALFGGGDMDDSDDAGSDDDADAMGDDASNGPSDADIDAFLSSLLSVPQDTTISHPKHGKKTIKKGVYKVRHKRPTSAKKAAAHRRAAKAVGHKGRHRAASSRARSERKASTTKR